MSKPEPPGPMEPDKPSITACDGAVALDQNPILVALAVPSSSPRGVPPQTEPTGKPPKAGKGRGGKMIAVLLAAALLMGGGFWIGKTTTDPKASEEYVALDARVQSTEKQRDIFVGYRDTLESQLADQKSDMESREAAVRSSAEALKTQEEGIKKREAAVSGAEKKQAANTVADGTWVVGVDIEAGTYKATTSVGSRCYWGIYTSGSNGDDIIANDLPGGGFPSVILAQGQDFKTARCGSWTRQ